ncbi:MAG: hypothetical protein A3D20_02955 [Nitrospinae bacterium RIFCSPHIGHO2_02_FULL_39_82]|nr:MAG: hypothetical protein A3D20_02955 [Nitrospinae bacterium RIFCSPHIGHO2_02_FULL_39_82]
MSFTRASGFKLSETVVKPLMSENRHVSLFSSLSMVDITSLPLLLSLSFKPLITFIPELSSGSANTISKATLFAP